MRPPLLLAILSLAAATISARAALASESYYVMIFGSESSPKRLNDTHTWATFIRAIGEGTDPAGYALEYQTVSWLPATGNVRVWAVRGETGMNLDLWQSLDFVLRNGESVTLWGPY